MTGDALEVRRRLAIFGDRPTSVPDAEVRSARRERIAARVLEVLDEVTPVRPKSKSAPTAWIVAAGTVAAAAGIALLVGLWTQPRASDTAPSSALASVRFDGPAECTRNEKTGGWSTCKPSDLGTGDQIHTQRQGRAELVTSSGARIALQSEGDLKLTDLSPRSTRVTLTRGRLSVRVPPLGPGGQFAVVTPSATVIVHGTAFEVEAGEDGAGRSKCCVRVSEGTVLVRSGGKEKRVSAHDTFGCEQESALEDTRASMVPVPSKPNLGTPAVRQPQRPAQSTLEIESRLLQDALGAEREGQLARAERTLVTLLQKYPHSVVVPEARAALRRIRSQEPER